MTVLMSLSTADRQLRMDLRSFILGVPQHGRLAVGRLWVEFLCKGPEVDCTLSSCLSLIGQSGSLPEARCEFGSHGEDHPGTRLHPSGLRSVGGGLLAGSGAACILAGGLRSCRAGCVSHQRGTYLRSRPRPRTRACAFWGERNP